MGHNTGWLALGAGLAGGADVILIPELPYNIDVVAESIMSRSKSGKRFSIVAVSEGAMSRDIYEHFQEVETGLEKAKDKKERKRLKKRLVEIEATRVASTNYLTQHLEKITKLESRVTILGHLQRGGIPSAADRLLATRLGTACTQYIQDGLYGVMVAARGEGTEPVPLEQVVRGRKNVPLDHLWIQSARDVGTCLGDV
jgi:6-phosphofructokinase 1